MSTSCGRENISKSLYQLHARNAQLVRNKSQNIETEVLNATRCFLQMKIDKRFVYHKQILNSVALKHVVGTDYDN